MHPGAKVHLRVVDPQGKPVTGVKTGGRRDRGHYGEEAEAQAAFDVVNLGPGEDRMVWLVHEGRKLGRLIHVKEGDDKDGSVVVTLVPSATITGRIVDADGNPVSGATIRPGLKPGGDFSLVCPGSRPAVTGDSPCLTCRPDASIRWWPKAGRSRPAAIRIQGCRRPTG